MLLLHCYSSYTNVRHVTVYAHCLYCLPDKSLIHFAHFAGGCLSGMQRFGALTKSFLLYCRDWHAPTLVVYTQWTDVCMEFCDLHTFWGAKNHEREEFEFCTCIKIDPKITKRKELEVCTDIKSGSKITKRKEFEVCTDIKSGSKITKRKEFEVCTYIKSDPKITKRKEFEVCTYIKSDPKITKRKELEVCTYTKSDPKIMKERNSKSVPT